MDMCRYYHDPEDGTACAKVACDCTHICVPSWHQMWMASLQVSHHHAPLYHPTVRRLRDHPVIFNISHDLHGQFIHNGKCV
jgi:hypothetical protein